MCPRLITRGREAQWRPCRIEPKALKTVDDWFERYRRFWEERLDRLEDYLKTLQTESAAYSNRREDKQDFPQEDPPDEGVQAWTQEMILPSR